MARITFSPLIVEASGKVKDTVFSRWKGRAYIRARVTPANPQSSAQTAVRNSLARCVTLWQSFQTVAKTAWGLYATPYSISGYNAFMSACRALEQAGSELLAMPVNALIDEASAFAAASGGASGEIDLTWSGGTQSADHKAYVLVRESGTNVFVVAEEATTLFSAGLTTLTGLSAGVSHQCYLIDEDTSDDTMSKSLSDTAVALA